jgi:S-adenosylmethionine:tRNA ribosyltransferase-isomerase
LPPQKTEILKKSLPQININDFDYVLPPERIAKHPLPRGTSKLLVNKAGKLQSSTYANLAAYLPPKAHLVFNQTKVVQARLLFPKNENTVIEVFCLEPALQMSVEQAMQQKNEITYKCLVGGAKKWKQPILHIQSKTFSLSAERLNRQSDHFEIKLTWEGSYTFGEILDLAGKTPLPPYLKRAAIPSDKESYQTVYASRPGSVAAPTAGLHFNPAIFASLNEKGIEQSFLTLHVGAGTFKPVGHKNVAQHQMHAEEVQVDLAFVQQMAHRLAEGEKIIPVGTTSLRALESMYWLACLLQAKKAEWQQIITIPQWIGFENDLPRLKPKQAFSLLAKYLQENQQHHYTFYTQLIIAEGYRHSIINGLITNFHQPKSTLLLLIASLLGPAWRDMYQYALNHHFRFLSYGDGCLLLPHGT